MLVSDFKMNSSHRLKDAVHHIQKSVVSDHEHRRKVYLMLRIVSHCTVVPLQIFSTLVHVMLYICAYNMHTCDDATDAVFYHISIATWYIHSC